MTHRHTETAPTATVERLGAKRDTTGHLFCCHEYFNLENITDEPIKDSGEHGAILEALKADKAKGFIYDMYKCNGVVAFISYVLGSEFEQSGIAKNKGYEKCTGLLSIGYDYGEVA